MTRNEERELEGMIDYLVDFYKLDLLPRGTAQRIWFDTGLHKEIIRDYLMFYRIPANIRLIKEKTKDDKNPHLYGYIKLPLVCPYFASAEFKNRRFEISIDPTAYGDYEMFICVLIHELSHLILYSTNNKYSKSEVATDLLVLLYGIEKEFLVYRGHEVTPPGYISREQAIFAAEYVEWLRKKRRIKAAKGIKAKLKAWLK